MEFETLDLSSRNVLFYPPAYTKATMVGGLSGFCLVDTN
jgi:hypothetical protein